jgi:tRNA threonylcarbamoyladenosine biosynthesis protein TsaB
MALILSVETATEVCSVALSLNGNVIAMKEAAGTNEHSAQLTLFIEEVMKEAGKLLRDIDAVAVSMGPGSYTGLRIGVSTAKGLCFSLDKPMIAVSTLKAMALSAKKTYPELFTSETLLCPMIDARRMEVFTALYDLELNEVRPAEALILLEESFELFRGKQLAVFGNGAAKCRELFASSENIIFPGELLPSASSIGELAEAKYGPGEFENTAYFEPFYLKDFIAGKPRVKGLHD